MEIVTSLFLFFFKGLPRLVSKNLSVTLRGYESETIVKTTKFVSGFSRIFFGMPGIFPKKKIINLENFAHPIPKPPLILSTIRIRIT